ncbi:zinc finger protein 513a [Synchiropus splendidus]|uniref:zinc finger protein 513a n=1 Tax=Synchiropus splendidus TaxID=270530 RepID=UPI00237E0204|nr:zinc finger protein 513a [Synchiropus splendidus]XP_053743229.1 zinc finger protein 513a [Synchiropus splendidus]XP_053743230.1 zinc finger protein 513a [Synchiropus splendidus]XP_053743231.1 zinc finger protein 513a [Synchiropus splendidus]
MPRKKQQNPQPVKLDSEDGLASEAPANLTLDPDFLLEQTLDFGDPDPDNKIISLEKFSEVAAEIGFSVYPMGDEESPAYSHLSMESETDTSRSTTDTTREDEGRASQSELSFPSYLSCRGCGQLRDDPLGPVDLVGPYCLRCCKASRESKSSDFGFGGIGGLHTESQQQEDDEIQSDKAMMLEDNLPKLHSCHLCGFSSRYANHVKRHMKTHNGEKPYNCPLCSYASAQLVNLQRHLRIHTGEKPYKCESCAFACSSLGNLKRHMRMHVPSVGAGPDAPFRPSSTPSSLKTPAMEQGPPEEDLDASTKEVAKASSNLSLGSQNNYLPAFNSLKGASPQTAPASNPAPNSLETASTRSSRGGLGDSATLPPSLFPFTCRLCGVVLEDEDGSSAQICSKCTLEMLTKDSSSSPGSPSERSDKVYTCACCPFLTHYPNHLARHMKTHSGEKPYKCPQCEYASAHFDNLKRHHRVHTGEKPYKCHLCDYACGNLANLKRHQRVHSGAKPFQCALCNYSCNQSMNLKRHMLRHTGEKPYRCQDCGYTTGHWDNYKRHQKKHGLATDGWVKVPMTGHQDEEDEEDDNNEEEEGRKGMGVQAPRKDDYAVFV